MNLEQGFSASYAFAQGAIAKTASMNKKGHIAKPACWSTGRTMCPQDGGRLERGGGPALPPLLAWEDASVRHHLGSTTRSMTWMTPLLAVMSVCVTVALSTITLPPSVLTVSALP